MDDETTLADAKDRLREDGIVRGPDRYGNWGVPTGRRRVTDWQPGEPVTQRVLVRATGAIAGTPMADERWDWRTGRWVENVQGISEDDLASPLPQGY